MPKLGRWRRRGCYLTCAEWQEWLKYARVGKMAAPRLKFLAASNVFGASSTNSDTSWALNWIICRNRSSSPPHSTSASVILRSLPESTGNCSQGTADWQGKHLYTSVGTQTDRQSVSSGRYEQISSMADTADWQAQSACMAQTVPGLAQTGNSRRTGSADRNAKCH